jgi:hypothetical protein
VADLDIDTGKFAVSHELEKLRLGVAPIPIPAQIGRFAGVPRDDLKRARPVDPRRQDLPARYPGATVQGREVSDTNSESWCDPGDHGDDAAGGR